MCLIDYMGYCYYIVRVAIAYKLVIGDANARCTPNFKQCYKVVRNSLRVIKSAAMSLTYTVLRSQLRKLSKELKMR